jgi:predicted amidohydrolase
MAKVKVAAVQTYSELDNSEKNLGVVLRKIEEAAENGARLIVFPECMNAGYVWRDHDHALSVSDPIPGTFTQNIQKLCAKYSAYVAIGLSEADGNDVYNSAALVGPDGVIGKYQKNFLFDFDPLYFTKGTTGYPVFDTPVGRIGMFICGDSRIPEGARILALQGAEILLHITNSTTHEQHELHEPARGSENEVWMICADKAGKEEGLTYPGHSQIMHPDGSIVVRGSQHDHEIIYADIDTEEVDSIRQRADSLMRGRRPHTYGLLKQSYETLPYSRIAETPIVPSQLAVLASPAQVCNEDGDAEGTLRRAIRHGDEAGKENAGLIVFPELFMVPAGAGAKDIKASSDWTARVLKEFGAVASRWSAWYVLNLVEEGEGAFFNTSFVVGPDGSVVDKYRKIHLTTAESDWATPGQEYKVLQTPFGNLGLLTGHEVCFFEVSRVLTFMGADAIAIPSNFRSARELKLFTAERALENKIFVVAANRTDSPFKGGSTVILPNAAMPHKAGESQDDYVFTYMNLAWSRDKQIRPGTDLVKNRRPQFYEPLTGNVLS